MNFANNMKNLREEQNITQEQLADYLKVSRSTIAGYETKSRQPDFEKLEKISEFLHVSIDYLLTGKECKIAIINPQMAYSEKFLNREVLGGYQKLSLDA